MNRRDWGVPFGLALIVRLAVAALIAQPGYMDAAYYAVGAVRLAQGGFFHASAAALPCLYAAGIEGLDAAVRWVVRRRRTWRYMEAQTVFVPGATFHARAGMLGRRTAGALLGGSTVQRAPLLESLSMRMRR